MKNIISNLRNKPEKTKKIILWITIIALGSIMAIWWMGFSLNRISNFNQQDFISKINIQGLENELRNIPMPQLPATGE